MLNTIKSNQPQTLRQETCICSTSCSMLFDSRKVVSTSWTMATLPKCWKKGRDLMVTRVDRRAAEAEQAMEAAYQLIQIGK